MILQPLKWKIFKSFTIIRPYPCFSLSLTLSFWLTLFRFRYNGPEQFLRNNWKNRHEEGSWESSSFFQLFFSCQGDNRKRFIFTRIEWTAHSDIIHSSLLLSSASNLSHSFLFPSFSSFSFCRGSRVGVYVRMIS